MRFLPILIFTLFAITPTLRAQAPATQPALQASLLDQLSSNDFAIREAAQRQLEQVPSSQRAALAALAEKTADPELKERLSARLQQIDEQLAYAPLPISLHVKDADPDALAKALSHELRTPVIADVNPNSLAKPPAASFTIDADDQNFWDIYARLSQQHLLRVATRDDILSAPIFRLRTYQRFGPLVLFQARTSYSHVYNAQAAPGAAQREPTFTAIVEIAADPRIHVAQAFSNFVSSLVDQDGNTVWQQAAESTMRTASLPRWSSSFPLPYPPKKGQKLTAIGTARFAIQTSELRREFNNAETLAHESVDMGPIRWTISVRPPAKEGDGPVVDVSADNIGAQAPQTASCTFEDADGKIIGMPPLARQVSVSPNLGVGWAFAATGKSPHKLTLSIPQKTRDFSFDFKLPLVTE